MKVKQIVYTAYKAGFLSTFGTLLTANVGNGFRDHPANGLRPSLRDMEGNSPIEMTAKMLLHASGLAGVSLVKSLGYASVWPLTLAEMQWQHKKDGHFNHLLFPMYHISDLCSAQENERWKAKQQVQMKRRLGQDVSKKAADVAICEAAKSVLQTIL